MTRLDKHVATVQSKLAARRFVEALALSTLVCGGIALLAIIIQKLFQVLPANLPVNWMILGAGIACVTGALVYAYIMRPTAQLAAAEIDDKLRLKERFSTAIYMRKSGDEFARAAVKDAENTAEKVQLGKQFPLTFPRHGYTSMAVAGVALCVGQWVPQFDLFKKDPQSAKVAVTPNAIDAAKENVARALVAAEQMPPNSTTSEEFRKLIAELKEFSKASKLDDPSRANRKALQALQEINNSVAKEWDKAKKYAEAQNQMMQSLQPPDDAKGPVAEARKEIAKGNFDAAASEMEKAVKDFEKMDQKQKEDQAKQMADAAKQMEQIAKDPQVQQQIQQQLQQMGANQQQAQDMAKAMQQAAQGGQQGAQAQQQVQKMAQQLAQQMNNGQGPNQQQQQQMQQAMQQMQGQANAQQQAQALGQAAQQMAQAMQQGAQQQQANGQQNPQQQQAMQNAQAQMQQALQNMQGVKQDLQQMAQQAQNAQKNLQQGQQCANGQCPPGNQPGQPGQKPGQGQGQFAQGDPANKPGQGQGGPGQGQGGNTGKETSPFGSKFEQSASQDNEDGKILASYMVKDQAPTGEQKMRMAKIIEQSQREAADEVDSDHASRQAQKVAQEYFRTLQKETAPK